MKRSLVVIGRVLGLAIFSLIVFGSFVEFSFGYLMETLAATGDHNHRFSYSLPKVSVTKVIGRLPPPQVPEEIPLCHFEDGEGYYEAQELHAHNESGLDTHATKLSWNWIHIHSLDDPRLCKIADYWSLLRDSGNSSIHDQEDRADPRSPAVQANSNLTFLMLGDSLDRNIISSFICDNWIENGGYQEIKVPSLRKNRAKHLRQLTRRICTNHKTTFAFFKIFGMHHDCSNGGYVKKEDSRSYPTTEHRVRELLQRDILSNLDPNSHVVVMVASALWDLSVGCVNDYANVSDTYQDQYGQGIANLHAAIRAHLPRSPIYCHTSPPVTLEYDQISFESKFGRSRGNQEVLNSIMKETVRRNNLGTVIDWWAQAMTRPETELGVYSDGRHYKENASRAFFNMFLNTYFNQHFERQSVSLQL